MRYRIPFLLLAALLLSTAAPARADGTWCLSLAAGESMSSHHGSALDAALFAEVTPDLGLGVETGLAYMNLEPSGGIHVYTQGVGSVLGGVSDGLTRNRGYYLGPAVKLGTTFYAVASMGLYDLSDNAGHALGTRWGSSAGIGLSGRGRFEPRGELRYRLAHDASSSASAFLITLGFHIR